MKKQEKKEKRISFHLVLVEWDDACSHNGYWEAHKPDRPVRCFTVGHLLDHNRECVNIAVERFADKSFRDVHTIPRKMIYRITCLGPKKDTK